jgi:hypothetical protein
MTMDSPENERRDVIRYVELEAEGEKVEHAEKLASERIYGRKHDVWDIHTDTERWWDYHKSHQPLPTTRVQKHGLRYFFPYRT